jgi:hypothetical protein
VPAPPAASITDCIQFARQNIQFLQATLAARMTTWINTAFLATPPIFDDGQPRFHRLTNWVIPSARHSALITAPPTQVNVDACTDAVYRFCNATRDMNNEGIVTAGQLAAVVAAFNAAWS